MNMIRDHIITPCSAVLMMSNLSGRAQAPLNRQHIYSVHTNNFLHSQC